MILLLIALILALPLSPYLAPTTPDLYDLPALVVLYDPARGGINCDDDCDTIATGQRTDDMYGVVAACDQRLLGAWVTLDGVGTFHCLDTGPGIVPTYNEYLDRWVLYFDVMWSLEEDGTPPWVYSLTTWSVSWTSPAL